MRSSSIFIATLLFSGLVGNVYAKPTQALSFQHGEWELYCSNTGTCQAAGYQSDDGESLPASILLRRQAGVKQSVQTEFGLGSDYGETLQSNKLKNIHFYINNKDLGRVDVDGDEAPLMGVLNRQQSNALLQQANQSVKIEFKNNTYRWRVSDQGMTAVLLKMDDFQKRVGTKTALVKKGLADESKVLAAQAKIVVKKVKTAEQVYLTIQPDAKQYKALHNKLMAARPKQQDDYDACEGIYKDDAQRPQAIDLYKLTNNKVLATTLCWRGAYNEGYGAWVLDQSLSGKVTYVTEMASDIGSGEIYASQKGRGIGDCWSMNQWIWDGQNFVHTIDRWTGMCKGLAAGGIWSLDKIEAVVQE